MKRHLQATIFFLQTLVDLWGEGGCEIKQCSLIRVLNISSGSDCGAAEQKMCVCLCQCVCVCVLILQSVNAQSCLVSGFISWASMCMLFKVCCTFFRPARCYVSVHETFFSSFDWGWNHCEANLSAPPTTTPPLSTEPKHVEFLQKLWSCVSPCRRIRLNQPKAEEKKNCVKMI